MMHGWGFGGGGMGGMGGYRSMRRFEEQYHCYSVAAADKSHLEKGDKILLPPSAFDTLARLQVDYPMLFKLSAMANDGQDRTTHSGVLEFTAEEGCCYIPFWMMQNLLIDEGTLITVTNVSLPKATFVKLQPQSVDFLEISNPRAVLEHALRNFSCVSLGDIIQIPYNNKNYHFELKDVQPSPAACIIETDCNVDFDPPVGYVEPNVNNNNNNNKAGASGAQEQQQQQQQSSGGVNSQRSSACPSPTATLSTTSSVPGDDEGNSSAERKPSGTIIRNGEIVRPDEQSQQSAAAAAGASRAVSDMIAERIGQTGIQKNAAMPGDAYNAPQVDYWAISAGDGARLDGKEPATLKDSLGNVIDVRKLRAEVAAKRIAEQEATVMKSSLGTTTGKILADGKMDTTTTSTTNNNNTASTSSSLEAALLSSSSSLSEQQQQHPKRKKRIGSKFSKLKQSSTAFQGSSNTFHQDQQK